MPYSDIVTKLNTLMLKLRSLKLAGKLRTYTMLKPVLFNATRWTSIYQLLQRYIELRPIIQAHFASDSGLLEHLLAPKEDAEVDKLMKEVKTLNSVTVALQRESIDMASVRLLFNEILKNFPDLDKNNKYLSQNSAIVKDKHFEAGVVKIQEGNEEGLSLAEKVACARLSKANDEEVTIETSDLLTIKCNKKGLLQ